MKNETRRSFVRKAFTLSSGAAVLGSVAPVKRFIFIKDNPTDNVKVFIPMPLQIVIDDVGWWSGEDGSKQQEPYRTGINRRHVPADYQAIADLGKALGIRPQAATIMCEWDRENILRKVPTSTWMGEKWDNSKWIGPWYEEAAEIIRNNRSNFELTIHGIGHEYWEGGSFTRAEWTDSHGQMRPEDQVELHLDYFEKLLNQHSLGPMPGSFVPAAFRHSFGPSEGRKVSLASILYKRGVNYINTTFSSVYNRERVQYRSFGIDSGVFTVDRGDDEFEWLVFPAAPAKILSGPTCGLHWPNMLHPDPERNREVVEKWIKYLKPYNEKPEMMLAPDSMTFRNQLSHHVLTKILMYGNSVEFDFTETDKLPALTGNDELTVKIMTGKPVKFTPHGVTVLSQTHATGSEYIYILKLKRTPHFLKAGLAIE